MSSSCRPASPRARSISRVIFDLLSLAFCGILLWQLARFEISSWRLDDHAPTYLATPLWIPRLAMLIGAAALLFSMVRTLVADVVRLRPGRMATGKPMEGRHEP
jgi:TRAP-type transport system small permease protein